jgi:hypothetical protein
MKNRNIIRKAFGSELDFIVRLFDKKNVRTLKTFLGILIKSFIVAIIFTTIWLHTIRDWHITDPIHAVLMRDAQISLFGMYVSLTFIALHIVLQRYYKLVDYLLESKEGKEKAREYYHKFRKKAFPSILNLLIGFFSLMLIGITLLMPYNTYEFGFWEVFLSIFSMYAVFKVFLHLEDPTSGIWPLIDVSDFYE